MQDLQGKVAVITGGGSGLGRELALCCAARGMKLVLGDVDERGMQETVRLVEEAALEAWLQNRGASCAADGGAPQVVRCSALRRERLCRNALAPVRGGG